MLNAKNTRSPGNILPLKRQREPCLPTVAQLNGALARIESALDTLEDLAEAIAEHTGMGGGGVVSLSPRFGHKYLTNPYIGAKRVEDEDTEELSEDSEGEGEEA